MEAIDALGSEQLADWKTLLKQNSQQQIDEYLASNESNLINKAFNADINLDDHSGIEYWIESITDQNQIDAINQEGEQESSLQSLAEEQNPAMPQPEPQVEEVADISDQLEWIHQDSNNEESDPDQLVLESIANDHETSPSILVSQLMDLLQEPTSEVMESFGIQNQQELFEQGQVLPALNDENSNNLGTDPSTQDLDIPELMEEINNDDYDAINNDEAMMDDYSAILN